MRYIWLYVPVVILSPLVGCASWPKPSIQDVAVEQKKRKGELIESFEKKRDTAQFEAAMVRWREGDMAGCSELVNKLLDRTPEHRSGRLLRAELRLIEDKPQLAISDIESLVETEPEDAEAEHMLGLLLEAADRPQDALAHYERAAQLAPDSEVFATSYNTALVGEPATQMSRPERSARQPGML